MKSSRRAVIDVGTNSVKLLVADVCGADVQPVWEGSHQTRLGAGFYPDHRLLPGPIARTAETIAEFAAKAREHGATSIRIIATSASRDAVNASELTDAVQKAAGLRMEIISGDQEAEWVFQGVTTDPALGGRALLILDVGGGSTEFILGRAGHQQFSASFRMGTVRLLERIPHGDPPRASELSACRKTVREFLNTEVRPQLEPALRPGKPAAQAKVDTGLVGTGGTSTILARIEIQQEKFDRAAIESAILSLKTVRGHVERLWKMPLADREQIVGLPKRRADVILTGAVIYEAVMEEFGFDELRVSTRGLRFAAVASGGTSNAEQG